MFVVLTYMLLHCGHIYTPNYRPSKETHLREDISQQCPSQSFEELDLHLILEAE